MSNRFVKTVVRKRIAPENIVSNMEVYAKYFKEGMPDASEEEVFGCSNDKIAILKGDDMFSKCKLVYKVAQKRLVIETIKTLIVLALIIFSLRHFDGSPVFAIIAFLLYYAVSFITAYNDWLCQNRHINRLKQLKKINQK